MEDNPTTSPLKLLKNPTEYHLLALQQQRQQHNPFYGEQNIDFSDLYNQQQQQQFLSPASNSSPLQDYDEFDSTNTVLLHSQNYPFHGESPSDYSSSLDLFSPSQPFVRQNHIMATPPSVVYPPRSNSFDQQTFSAPANVGYPVPFQNPVNGFNQSIVATGSRSFEEYESHQLNQQYISEKKRRRRESHNLVERRRRENINERIQELGTMLPEAMIDELTTINANGSSNKPNKGAILRKSVDHIRILQQEVYSHKQRIHDLERQLADLS